MNTIQKIAAFSFFLFINACGQNPSNSNIADSDIQKVTVAFSGAGCESEYPFEALSTDSSFSINYYGGRFAEKKGYFKGHISPKIWDSIQSRFHKFISKGIDTIQGLKTDQPHVEFYITDGRKKHFFKENTGKMSRDDLSSLFWFIRMASNNRSMSKSDSLAFETSIQYFTLP